MYRIGAYVEVVSVDRYGLQGRVAEPPRAAEGRVGRVTARYADPGDPALDLYRVDLPGLGAFELAGYELN